MTPVAECENDICKVDVDYDSWVVNELEARIERFVDAVEADGRLKILGTTVEDYGECFIIDDTRFDDAQTLFLVSEVLDKCVTKHMAARIVRCIIGEEKSIVLNGMTRIVGYYSRMSNWNKSKIGELRDRNQGNYKVGNEKIRFDAERMKAINGLSNR